MSSENRPGRSYSVKTKWAEEIPDDQWEVYQRAINKVRERGIQFAIGGALAIATYTGRWRNTKDIDLYVTPQDREKMIEAITDAGLEDYFDVLPYQRHWIYRAHVGDYIVDTIWAMANERDEVDEIWIKKGPEIEMRGQRLQIIPPEELIWAKLYVLQKDRCDWPDVFNIIYAEGDRLDWEHLLSRLRSDRPLLAGCLFVFAWLSHEQAQKLPQWLWERIQLPEPEEIPSPQKTRRQRASILDSRPWYIPVVPKDVEPFP